MLTWVKNLIKKTNNPNTYASSILSLCFSCICMSLSRFLRKCHFLEKKKRIQRNPTPSSFIPDLAPIILQALFSAMWLTLSKEREFEGNFLLTASTPEFPSTSFTVVSTKLSCFSLANKCSSWPRVCAESVWGPSTALPFSSSLHLQPSVLAEALQWKAPLLLPHQYQICVVLHMFLPHLLPISTYFSSVTFEIHTHFHIFFPRNMQGNIRVQILKF